MTRLLLPTEIINLLELPSERKVDTSKGVSHVGGSYSLSVSFEIVLTSGEEY